MTIRRESLLWTSSVVLALACMDLACSDAADGGKGTGGAPQGEAGQNGEPQAGESSSGGKSSTGGKSSSGGKASGGSATTGGKASTGGSNTAGSGDEPVAGAGSDPDPNPTEKVRFFLPTGEPDNTAQPAVEVDAKGGLHTVYPAYAGGRAYYAYCGANCSGSDDVQVVQFETDATVPNAMLALDAQGRPRVLLSSFNKVFYATCDAACGDASNWTVSEVLDHDGDREVSGEAFALDSNGNPRFLMHTYRAFLGIGQKAPETFLVSCDEDCHSSESWQSSRIAEEIWESSALRFDGNDVPHVATVVRFATGDNAGEKMSAYLSCKGDCTDADNWNGIGFMKPYENETAAVRMPPMVSMALTKAGKPRVVVLGDNAGAKNLIYFECDDEDCTADHWQGALVSEHEKIDVGFDLALDQQDRPRLVYTLNYNIGLAYCDGAHCGGPEASWDLTPVELGSEMKPDEIFLWDNCTVAAWFLHSPSVALTRDGKPRVGYQARDISGGVSNPDPTKPRCVAGTDMTWTRMAVMPSYQATE
ncbi:MAG TPA: hypothetical protein VFQ61_00770 [Polyangiaceae bacterium]|nr:hypothetical protein [Polyangiaceae bacterium]